MDTHTSPMHQTTAAMPRVPSFGSSNSSRRRRHHKGRCGAALLLLLPLALLVLALLLPGAQAGFSWPGSGGSQKQEDTNKDHASASASVTGGRLPKGVCLRRVRTAAVSTHAYPANNPIEDRHVLVDEQAHEGQEDADGKPLPGMLHAAVFDGHGGFEVAERVHTALVPKMKETLLGLPRHLLFDERVVTNALVHAFVEVEKEWITHVEALPDRQARFKKSTVGACALYALLMHSTLFVANAGDCRAVLARRRPLSTDEDEGLTDTEEEDEEEGEGGGLEKEAYEALPLSFDHNSREQREQARLIAEHPGEEEDIVKCYYDGRACYVKGRLQPVRAFGDLHLKLDEFSPPPESGITWTPPYVTAIPEIVSLKLNRLDSFLVMASDGLWDNFSNAEVVAMVADMRRKGLSPEETAEALTEAALARVAQELHATVEQVKALAPGRERRGRHDDITVVVLFFEETRQGDCPLPGTPAYEAELEEDEDDLSIVDGNEDEGYADYYDAEDEMDEEYWDEDAWIEMEEWDEDEEEWDEDVDIDFMEEL